MNAPRGRPAPYLTAILGASGLTLVVSGCTGMSVLNRQTEPVPVTSTSPERAAAIADMRAKAEAGDPMPFPDAFQADQTNRLALRGEPRSLAEVQAIEAELTVIAERRAATTDPSEIAALEKRARELRRLALASQGLRQ